MLMKAAVRVPVTTSGGYQYALPFLFPEFARQTLEIDYTYNMKESGEMMFRTMLPLGSGQSNFRACVDGQMGCVLRFYREWNPFSEIECGASYSRSISSFALPAVFSGYRYDMVKKEIGFCPVVNGNPFVSFWSVDGAWGTVEIGDSVLTLNVSVGVIKLNAFTVPTKKFADEIKNVLCDGESVNFAVDGDKVTFEKMIKVNEKLIIRQ